jgi:hypothetical protein
LKTASGSLETLSGALEMSSGGLEIISRDDERQSRRLETQARSLGKKNREQLSGCSFYLLEVTFVLADLICEETCDAEENF